VTGLPQLYTVKQLALAMRVTDKWIYRAHASHGLPATRVGRSLLFDPASVNAWLSSNEERRAE
jgi:excisionase family DNA binding protein